MIDTSDRPTGNAPRVGLFVTCLVDLFRPTVGFAAVSLLESAGCRVEVPTPQTCCGQPAYNTGDDEDAKAIARSVITAFEGYDYVVAPSGSCAGMLRTHYPELLGHESGWGERARAFAGRCHELLSFLHDERGFTPGPVSCPGTATYHDSCSGLREMGVKQQPRALLDGVEDLVLKEMADTDVCCGFGGTFCVKYPEISERLVSDKVSNVQRIGAELVLGGDLGCLLNIAGRLHRLGAGVRVYHAAEVLAGRGRDPAIGEPGTATRP